MGCFQPSGEGTPYSIMLPPPNVTGTLHMGHAFQHTLQDALIRWHRMRGYDTLWQIGTDHAGIATEMVVGRLLEREGQTRNGLGRPAFIERVWQWKQESGSTITRQMRRLGTSGDWTRERFTMDEGLSAAVVETFVRLHDEGLIYRGQRLVNWDPVLLTAISDLEVVSEEEQGKLWSIHYPLADGSGQLTVATTRPETMLGDVAVAVHPEDERYRHLVGKSVRLPLCEREIPVIGDDYVEREFGTGVVKITPAHDFNDYAIGKRHGLAPLNIFTLDAKINDHAPAKYRGMDRYVARKAVLADLEAAGLLGEAKAAQADGPARRPQRPGDRADAHRPVVRAHGHAGRARPRAGAQRQRALRARELGLDLRALDEEHPGLVHQPPALVGPSHPGLVRRSRHALRGPQRGRGAREARARRARCARTRTCSRPGSAPRCGRIPRWAGRSPPTWRSTATSATCRARCWSPASTSSSSGSPG